MDDIYPKAKRAKIEPHKPSKRNLFTLLKNMHTAVRQIKAQLSVLAKKKETWLESSKKVAQFDENTWESLALHLMEYEQMEQIRCIVMETKGALEGGIGLVVENLEEVNKDMSRVIKALMGVTKDLRHVVAEVKDLSNDVCFAMSELVKMNQDTNLVPVRKKLKKMTNDMRRVKSVLAVMEKETMVGVNLKMARPQKQTKGCKGGEKLRSKSTEGMHIFRRRERKLKSMKVALEQPSVVGPRIKYTAIWTEFDGMWHKLMAHERDKLFSKKRKCAKKVSDKPMKTFDDDLDKLESWISVL
jgi:archaellum component FlaC